MLGMGGGLDPKPIGDRHQKTSEAHVTMELPQPRGFQDSLNEEFLENTALDARAVQIWSFLTKGARQVDAARQEFEHVVKDFRAEREDLHEDMQILHADRVDPRSINGMVEESIASLLRSINSDVMGVVSTLALNSKVQRLPLLNWPSSPPHDNRILMSFMIPSTNSTQCS